MSYPSIVSKQAAQAHQDRKRRALDAGMTEARFQAICTTRYIIRKLLSFSHVECQEFQSTVHVSWKVIKTKTVMFSSEMQAFSVRPTLCRTCSCCSTWSLHTRTTWNCGILTKSRRGQYHTSRRSPQMPTSNSTTTSRKPRSKRLHIQGLKRP